MNTASIVQKLWNYCSVLRDDGMSYGDYVEQLTYLLFLNMADERTRAPYKQKSPVPEQCSWPSLDNCSMRCPTSCIHAVVIRKDGGELFDHYRHTLEALGNQKGLLGLIFNKSQNKFDSAHPWASACGRAARAQIRSRRICQDPAKLRRLIVDLIDKETWVSTSSDVKGDAYEGLLEKNAQDTRSGAGQYFTPRPLIDSGHPGSSASGRAARAQFRSRRNCQAIVDVMAPQLGETVSDPACGTGGFLLAA